MPLGLPKRSAHCNWPCRFRRHTYLQRTSRGRSYQNGNSDVGAVVDSICRERKECSSRNGSRDMTAGPLIKIFDPVVIGRIAIQILEPRIVAPFRITIFLLAALKCGTPPFNCRSFSFLQPACQKRLLLCCKRHGKFQLVIVSPRITQKTIPSSFGYRTLAFLGRSDFRLARCGDGVLRRRLRTQSPPSKAPPVPSFQ